MLGIAAGAIAGASALPVAIKAVGELHRAVFQSELARQGQGIPVKRGEGERLQRQKVGGISGGVAPTKPGYFGKVPSRPLAGDLRKEYEVGGLGDATSSRSNLEDILDKVPRKMHGTESYKRIVRPTPTKKPGYDNQAYP